MNKNGEYQTYTLLHHIAPTFLIIPVYLDKGKRYQILVKPIYAKRFCEHSAIKVAQNWLSSKQIEMITIMYEHVQKEP